MTTRDVAPGMQVLLPHVLWLGRLVHTIARVAESGWLNAQDEPLVTVYCAEPADSHRSNGNCGLWDSEWTVIETP